MTDFGGHRGRSRVELEYDVLGALFLLAPFRERARPKLTAALFTTSDHRALYAALVAHQGPLDDPAALVARTLGIPYASAEAWLTNTLPVTYDEDLEALRA